MGTTYAVYVGPAVRCKIERVPGEKTGCVKQGCERYQKNHYSGNENFCGACGSPKAKYKEPDERYWQEKVNVVRWRRGRSAGGATMSERCTRCLTCDRVDCVWHTQWPQAIRDEAHLREHRRVANECQSHAVDWRARCLAAEAVIKKADELSDALAEADRNAQSCQFDIRLNYEMWRLVDSTLAAYRLARGAR